MEGWQLVARELIRETLARYVHLADSGRFAELTKLFTDDGALEIHGRDAIRGRQSLFDFFTATKSSLSASLQRPYIRHHLSSTVIDLENHDRAEARSYFLAITERGPDHWGRYRDVLVCTGEQWLFQQRFVRADGHAPDSWRATR